MCVSFFLLSIGYNLSNITYSMGDIRNNSIINVVKSIVYLGFLFVLAKTMGMTGVLIAFLLPLVIIVVYYPRKVTTEAVLSKENVKDILIETIRICILILVCALLVSALHYELSWAGLIAAGALYTILFAALLFYSSHLFKTEMKGAFAMLQQKIGKK